MPFPFADEDSQGLELLDEDHRKPLDRAVSNLLGTDIAEFTYAQILDGLPTEKSLRESFAVVKDHPVYTKHHAEICPGFLDKARKFRAQFTTDQLRFQSKPLIAFQDAPSKSNAFQLRLIELVVVACHQIGAYLYDLDDGAHKHQVYNDWVEQVLEEKKNGVQSRKYLQPPPTAFSHRSYWYPDQYPRGLADVAGYWAESKIFGGVVVFDRGETEQECKSMWIHEGSTRGPRTLYPPTQEQFDSLVNFLLAAPDEELTSPLPIHGARINRPRWHPYHAFAYYHIFRDKYERKLPPNPPQPGCVRSGIDWPELDDERILLMYSDADETAAAEVRIRNITPSSPLWQSSGEQTHLPPLGDYGHSP
ncbi:hypothetical protein G7046_g454 [Stylonectria norvegica]|nr:hypothetical protein G7046_g454 [Stylonectria norvegica]